MTGKKYIWLDLLRALSALIVFVGHTREIVFKTFTEVKMDTGVLTKLFYFISGMGPEAVMIFFVLSGFFITKTIDVSVRTEKYVFFKYMIARLSRLWAVLIPVLITGFIFDYIRLVYYSNTPYSLNFQEFFGNMFFMQNILCHTFGSNGALWSLSYEWWFYMFFPFVYLTVYLFSKEVKKALLHALVFLAMAIFISCFNFDIVLYFSIWLLGSLSYFILKRDFKIKYIALHLIVAVGLLFASLSASRLHLIPSDFLSDLAIGLSCVYLIILLVKVPQNINIKSITIASDISYSLYAFHFPMAYLLSSVFNFKDKEPTVINIVYFILMDVFILLCTYLIWYAFERNTHHLKNFLETNLIRIKSVFLKVKSA